MTETTGTVGPVWQFTFGTVAGRTYRLQRTDSVTPASWQSIGAIVTGSGQPLVFQDPVNTTMPCRFYRIVIQP